ncbi:MAG: bifunctional metallophosphatase/5'-nucleotidase [Candidatus Cloacimonetes bacterium]|jgi:2',3'-cyclic-nucleotide 2'-phosphodiesterase (5'-nucleotidase family)|nr:bifunctional metallophosphatase/5'-nucleotidase [Candidatus Cloacimonadota bacterium]MBT5420016.1 bifunctional metallophosphatase/5'-nucleotidase [Candidatus Cloacimonadota bacterium]
MKTKLLLVFLLLFSSMLLAEDLLLDIMFTNDIHGGIDRYPATFMNPDFPPILGGGGSAATYIKGIRKLSKAGYRDNLLVDAGDFYQGHPVGTMSEGRAVITYMNMIGYDFLAIGNHEFDLGEEILINTLADAEFPILSCNIVKKGTDELIDYVLPYKIIEKIGVRIGVIGVTTTDTEQMSFPDNIKNVDFLPAKEQLQKYVNIVREKDVDIVIVIAHMGLPYYPQPAYDTRYSQNIEGQEERRWGYDAQEIAHEVEGIDIMFGGHMHKGFAEPWEDPDTHTMVLQGYAYGSSVGHVTIQIDKETKTIFGYEVPAIKEGVLVTMFEDEYIPDVVIGDTILVMQQIAEVGMDEIIGQANMNITKIGSGPQNLIGNLVCEAMKDYTGADFSFMNLGGIRDELLSGPITYRDVFSVMPFDNQIALIEVDGTFLKEIIETRVSGSRHGLRTAGIKVVINRKRDNFNRVSKLIIGGEPWQADKIYKIATSDFLLQGNAGLALLTQVPESQITRYEQGLRDVIVEYIKNNSPVSAVIDNRWKRDDSSKIDPNLEKELRKGFKN